MNSLSGVRSVTADISYADTDTNSDFRVHLAKKNDETWHPIILIVSRGVDNPLDYFSSTYKELTKFVTDFNLDISKCTIYIDLMEYLGIFQAFLFKWEVKMSNNKALTNKVYNIDIFSIPDDHRKVLQNFYKGRWSAFSESCLSSEEKVKLIASILSTSIFDDKSANQLQNDFKYRLFEALENGKGDILNFIY